MTNLLWGVHKDCIDTSLVSAGGRAGYHRFNLICYYWFINPSFQYSVDRLYDFSVFWNIFLMLDLRLYGYLCTSLSVIFSKTRWENAIMQTSSRVSFIYQNDIFSRTHAGKEEGRLRNLSKYFGHCGREIWKYHQCMHYSILLNKL